MATIKEILGKKGSNVHSIDGKQTVFDAVSKMAEHKVGALLVLEGDNVCGIVTERDFLRKIALEDRTSKTTTVNDISSCNLVVVEPSNTVEEAMAVMTEQRIRHLPVFEDGKLSGLVSIGDLVKQASSDQEFQIRYLTDYVTDKYPA